MGLKFYKIEGKIIKHYWTTLLTLRTWQISYKEGITTVISQTRKVVLVQSQHPVLFEKFSKLRIKINLDNHHTFKSEKLQACSSLSEKNNAFSSDSKVLYLIFIILLFSNWMRQQIKQSQRINNKKLE